MQRLTQYIFQKFLGNFVLFATIIAFVAWVFEIVTRKKPDHFTHGEFFYEIFLKIPFILHKGFFFLIFVVTCFSLWGLLRWKENIAMSSAGMSLWRMTVPIFTITFFFCMVDLFYVDPLSQSLLLSTKLPSSSQSTNIMHSEKGWKKFHGSGGVVLFYFSPQGESEWYFFSHDGRFVQQFCARYYLLNEKDIFLKDLWVLQPGKTPQKVAQIVLKKPQNFSQKDFIVHPVFMSFTDIVKNFFIIPGRSMTIRFFYLLSSMCTILLCVFFAAGIVMGYHSYKQRLLWIFLGGCFCFFIYLFQEYLYLIALSRSYSFPIGLFGVPPLAMFASTLILWTEKNQW